MPNSLKCKIKRLCHNGTLKQSECDRLLQALEQEPCEDCVSRAWIREHLGEFLRGCRAERTYEEIAEDIEAYIDHAPSVTPKQMWIPVSERLPEEYGVYLVTIGDSTDFCIWNKKEWGWESRKGWEPNIEITAWMPLPEPWEGESEWK